MAFSWETGFIAALRTVSQILTAGIAITAFALLLHTMTYNLRDRVARTFAFILVCVVIAFTGEAIGSNAGTTEAAEFWLRVQWIGIVMLPANYLHFSDALLATTGRPSRGRRIWAIRLTYFACIVFLIGLPFSLLVGPLVMNQPPAPHLQRTIITDLFTFFYASVMLIAWSLFLRSYQRTKTPTSRRRMIYLGVGALAPAMGVFPYLLFGSEFAASRPTLFWSIALLSNLVVGALLVVMAYAVAFFGVSWPDRVVKSRLFKWILRGPVTASITLGLVTIIRRAGEVYGQHYTALVPIVMTASILLMEYLITFLSPEWERKLFVGKDRQEIQTLHNLEDRMMTRNDLNQFLEMVLAAVCDRLQAAGAYLAVMNGEKSGQIVRIGKASSEITEYGDDVKTDLQERDDTDLYQLGDDCLIPLREIDEEGSFHLYGIMGITGLAENVIEEDARSALNLLASRATRVLRDWKRQQKVLLTLEPLTSEMEELQRMRAAASYNDRTLLLDELPTAPQEMIQWVKDALTHYWGGPKLTDSPLMRLRIVQREAGDHDGNLPNALRSILKKAIEQTRPEGERRFTGEWILYNILEMKFLEGRKVREIAIRLSMSEADLYRKQKIAIETVARSLDEMETQVSDDHSKGSD
jgi:hypothetical protein